MTPSFHSSKGIIQSQHHWFLWGLEKIVGPVRAARMPDGQVWEQTYRVAGTWVALSDTERNTRTDKKGVRHSYGVITVECIATEPARQRQGAATHQLSVLGLLADKWNIRLRLRVMAHETSPLNDKQLRAWYQKLGYTDTDGRYLSRPSREQRTRASAAQANAAQA